MWGAAPPRGGRRQTAATVRRTMSSRDHVQSLVEHLVRSTFESNPAAGRTAGDHACDGRLADVGRAALSRRGADLEAQALALAEAGAGAGGLDAEVRADLGTARGAITDELFRLRVLDEPANDPTWALWRGCDVYSYVIREYAPAAERAQRLAEHLGQLPDWLDAAAALLAPELPTGPRGIAVESLQGHASFYRDDIRPALGELDAGLTRRLDTAIDGAAAAVERHAVRLQASAARDDWALGPDRFAAMLHAQEGVQESAGSLRAMVDAEMATLTARAEEAAARRGEASPAVAFAVMESDHPSRESLLDTASGMLADLRRFWLERDVMTIPEDVDCSVRRSPSFFSFITAAFDAPGFLDARGLANYYYVTPVDPAWSEQQADDWLRHLNNATLLNISVHEVFPGHFVQSVRGYRNPTLVRNALWYPGFGEGWAHYTELLGVEQGLGEAHPWLELAMVQDALLRCARFSATVGMHAEGRSLTWATDMIEQRAFAPRLAAEREALRGTWDPMYLSYTYGKLAILRWRRELEVRPGYTLKRFHDRLTGGGSPPLAVMEEYVLGAAGDWLTE